MAINFVCELKDSDDCELVNHWAGMIRANCGFKHEYTCVIAPGVFYSGIHKSIKIVKEMPKNDYFFLDLHCVLVDDIDSLLLHFGYRTPGGAVINRLKYPLTESRLKGNTYFYNGNHGVYSFSELHVKAEVLHPPENSVIIHLDGKTKPDHRSFMNQCTWARAFYNEHIYDERESASVLWGSEE